MDLERIKTEIYNLPVEKKLYDDENGNPCEATIIKVDRDYLWNTILKAIPLQDRVMPNEVLAGGSKRLKQDLRGILNDMNKWVKTKDEYRAKSEVYILETVQTCKLLLKELESQREA